MRTQEATVLRTYARHPSCGSERGNVHARSFCLRNYHPPLTTKGDHETATDYLNVHLTTPCAAKCQLIPGVGAMPGAGIRRGC